MTVVSTNPDTDALTLTMVSDLAAPPERVWELWSDPRQLERWWGPPTYPATFERHDFVVDGDSRYFMTGPDGDKSRGWFKFVAIDEPRSIEFDEGFADTSGEPSDKMPTSRMRVELAAGGAGTRMTVTTRFANAEDMKMLVEMGMAEGMAEAMNQIDAILAG